MNISTGKVAFNLTFDNGEKETIYFNPNDRKIHERIKKFYETVQKRIEEIDVEKYKKNFNIEKEVNIDLDNPERLFELSPKELEEIQKRLDIINDIEAEHNRVIKDELDVVFNSKISDVAFKHCEPFDVVIFEDENGEEKREIYILHFMKWLTIELKAYSEKNKAAMSKHLSKYNV